MHTLHEHPKTKLVIGIVLVLCVIIFLSSVQHQTEKIILREDFSYVVKTPNLLKEELKSPSSKDEVIKEAPSANKAEELRKAGRLDEALSLYYNLYSKESSNDAYLERIGEILIEKQSWTNARDAYKKIMIKGDYAPQINTQFLRSYLHTITRDEIEHAKEEIKTRMTNLPSEQEHKNYFECMLSLLTEENVKEQCAPLEKSTHVEYQKTWTTLQDRVQRYETQRDGDTSYLSLMYAGLLSEEGWYNLSLLKAQTTIQSKPEYRDAWILAGYDLIQMKYYDKALFYLEEAYKKDTTKVHVQYLLGVVYDHLGNKEKAVSYYTIALKNKFPAEKELIKRIGELYVSMNKYDLALQLSLEQIKNQPQSTPEDYIDPLWILITIQKQPTIAVQIAQEGQNRFPGNPLMNALESWTSCYEETGKNEAFSSLLELSKANPEEKRIHILATRCAIELKKKKEAEVLLDELKKSTSDKETYRQIQDLSSLIESL